jgi:hypothetical protein
VEARFPNGSEALIGQPERRKITVRYDQRVLSAQSADAVSNPLYFAESDIGIRKTKPE